MNVIGIGIDLVEIDRLRSAVEKHGDRFYDRVLTPGEKAYCQTFHDPLIPFSSRFAAKEAVSKALGTGISGGIHWTDIEVERLESGSPLVRLHGEASEKASSLLIREWRITLTHTHRTAAAVALAIG